jgi:magnesium transporter
VSKRQRVPLIISSGGNSGSQATTLVIRAMALGEVQLRDWWRVIRRELTLVDVTGLVIYLTVASMVLRGTLLGRGIQCSPRATKKVGRNERGGSAF